MRSFAAFLAILILIPAVGYPEGYKIRPGDELSISVREAPEFDGTYVVAEDSNISFPEVGEVKAAGLEVSDVAAALREGLQKSYLSRANVRVRVSKYTPVRYFVLGSVTSPGVFEITPGTKVTLLQAIAFAGGLKEDADLTCVTIMRKGEGSIKVDISPALEKGDSSCDCELLEDDIVVVLKKKELFAYVLGSVTSGGRIAFPANIKSLPLGVVIALAGGLSNVKDGEVHVYPEDALGVVTPKRFQVTEKGLDAEAMAVPVYSGETVFVLDRQTKIYVLGKVRNPGAVQYRKGITISEAVALAGGLADGCAENRTRIITTNEDGSRTVREVNLAKVLSPGDGESFNDIELSPWTIIVIPESRI
ncbi:MAG: hypothetical protein Kow00107_09180 [Planctomycetota bacterium]